MPVYSKKYCIPQYSVVLSQRDNLPISSGINCKIVRGTFWRDFLIGTSDTDRIKLVLTFER